MQVEGFALHHKLSPDIIWVPTKAVGSAFLEMLLQVSADLQSQFPIGKFGLSTEGDCLIS